MGEEQRLSRYGLAMLYIICAWDGVTVYQGHFAEKETRSRRYLVQSRDMYRC